MEGLNTVSYRVEAAVPQQVGDLFEAGPWTHQAARDGVPEDVHATEKPIDSHESERTHRDGRDDIARDRFTTTGSAVLHERTALVGRSSSSQ